MSSPLRRLLLALSALAPLASGQDLTQEAWEQMRRHMAELQQQVGELTDLTKTLQAQLDARQYGASSEDEYFIPRLASEFHQSGQAQNFGGTYTKPFLGNVGERTYLGGYIDLEFTDPRGSANKEFDQHRFVPFIYADVNDRVKVSTEIEFEHGHELEVEFAQIDYLLNDNFNVRTGIQLLPLGKLNAVHDSPVQDLTFRPLVNTYIIPTTLRDAGIGFWGEVCETVDYEVTITNGFRGLDKTGKNVITATKGLRDAAPHKDKIGGSFESLNDKLAYTGRLAWSPELGVEVGASALFDSYDEFGDNQLNIYALDFTIDGKACDWIPDNVEILGEGARADIERNAFALAANDGKTPLGPLPVAGDMQGYYVQANVHFDPEFLDGWRQGGIVSDDAHFTFVTRYDDVQLDTYNMNRTTFGLNFRPNAHDTVYKLDYQFNSDSGSASGTNTDDAIVFSAATYF